jgi:hypothetical protein
MIKRFYAYHGYQPGDSEVRSWENSLKALGEAVAPMTGRDIGVVVEYHLPYSNQRIDAVFLGKSVADVPQALVVELKQWSQVDLEDEFALNVLVDGQEHAHPSQQALDYAGSLRDIHSSFVEGRLTARSCSFCHNLPSNFALALTAMQFKQLVEKSPLFKRGDEGPLGDHVVEQVGNGCGRSLLMEYSAGRFKPSKKLLEEVEATIRMDDKWHLLGRQREAYNEVFAQVRRLQKKRGRSAVLIRGGPGTGKTVIAVQLLADCLRLGLTAAHSTGGKAFTKTLQSKFRGAGRLFIWNMNTRNAPPQSLDLLLVDEAHRVRETSNTRWIKRSEQSDKSQMQELLDCSKVAVFLLDENQYVRPDEIGCSRVIREAARSRGVPLKEFDLDTQFRCGGCVEYTTWVDYLLGYEPDRPKPWGQSYRLRLASSPHDLDRMMAEAKRGGERARITAGFCWPWSDVEPGGTLVHDVDLGDWTRPWNAKEQKGKTYTPSNHPYTLWAETAAGEGQVGCIYSIQGFEFDRVGVIWGPDLVWRGSQWVAQQEHTCDKEIKKKGADTLRLVRNAYRVLLTRGMKETCLLCLDGETRDHVGHELEGMQSP